MGIGQEADCGLSPGAPDSQARGDNAIDKEEITMKTKRRYVVECLGRWCISVALLAILGLAECGATEPLLLFKL